MLLQPDLCNGCIAARLGVSFERVLEAIHALSKTVTVNQTVSRARPVTGRGGCSRWWRRRRRPAYGPQPDASWPHLTGWPIELGFDLGSFSLGAMSPKGLRGERLRTSSSDRSPRHSPTCVAGEVTPPAGR